MNKGNCLNRLTSAQLCTKRRKIIERYSNVENVFAHVYWINFYSEEKDGIEVYFIQKKNNMWTYWSGRGDQNFLEKVRQTCMVGEDVNF